MRITSKDARSITSNIEGISIEQVSEIEDEEGQKLRKLEKNTWRQLIYLTTALCI